MSSLALLQVRHCGCVRAFVRVFHANCLKTVNPCVPAFADDQVSICLPLGLEVMLLVDKNTSMSRS